MQLLSFLVLSCSLPFILIRPSQVLVRTTLICIFALMSGLLIIDVFIFHQFHFHLNQTILTFIFSSESRDIFDLSAFEEISIVIVMILILLIEYVALKYLQPKVDIYWQAIMRACLSMLILLLVSYLILLTSMIYKNNLLTQQVSNLPLAHQIVSSMLPGKNSKRILYNFSENFFSLPNWGEGAFNYPITPLSFDKPRIPFNIIFITAEALRFDNLAKGVMPKLVAFSKKNLNFTNHYSASNETQGGLFSLFYGLPENYWAQAITHKIPPILMQVLKKNHYDRKVIWSSEMKVPAFYKNIYLGVNKLRLSHQKGSRSSDWDRHTTIEASSYLADLAKRKSPFFLHVFYNTTHAYCQNNRLSRWYHPVLEHCTRLGSYDQVSTKKLYNRYKNAARFIDNEINKLINKIDSLGLMNRSIIIITGDHGEEFNDTGLGYFGHAGNFTHYQLHVPMVIHWPEKTAAVFSHPTNHYDVSTTLLTDLFHSNYDPKVYGLGHSLFHFKRRKRLLLVSSYAYFGMVNNHGITVLQRSGEVFNQDNEGNAISSSPLKMSEIRKLLHDMSRLSKVS